MIETNETVLVVIVGEIPLNTSTVKVLTLSHASKDKVPEAPALYTGMSIVQVYAVLPAEYIGNLHSIREAAESVIVFENKSSSSDVPGTMLPLVVVSALFIEILEPGEH